MASIYCLMIRSICNLSSQALYVQFPLPPPQKKKQQQKKTMILLPLPPPPK